MRSRSKRCPLASSPKSAAHAFGFSREQRTSGSTKLAVCTSLLDSSCTARLRRALVGALLLQLTLLAGAAQANEAPVGELDGQPVLAGTAIEVTTGAVKNLKLENGARIALQPGTSAIVSASQWYPPEQGTKSIRGSRLYLKQGEVTVSLAEGGAKPTAVAVVSSGGQTMLLWRGITRVSSNDGDVTVAVDAGASYVGAEDRWLRMSAGSGAIMPKKAPPQPYKRRLAAPQLVPCPAGDVGLAFGPASEVERGPARVCWSAVEGATGYRVELATDEAMHDVVESVVVPRDALAATPSVAPGKYHARVLSTTADGVPGLPSASRPAHVVRAVLPSGATMAKDGVVLLTREGTVALDAPGIVALTGAGTDVTAAMGNALASTAVGPVPKSIGLAGFRARAVRLRDAAGGETRLVLLLRELSARVEMSPPHARWPKDPIDVSVVLEDSSKRVDLATEPVTVEVAVDSHPVPSTWTRSGDTFRTRIAPIDGPGPFLVRVVAKDRTGKEIGAHVLDIDGRRPIGELENVLMKKRQGR